MGWGTAHFQIPRTESPEEIPGWGGTRKRAWRISEFRGWNPELGRAHSAESNKLIADSKSELGSASFELRYLGLQSLFPFIAKLDFLIWMGAKKKGDFLNQEL